jgi:hypothetical protein
VTRLLGRIRSAWLMAYLPILPKSRLSRKSSTFGLTN